MDPIWLISSRGRVFFFLSLSQSAGGFGQTRGSTSPIAPSAGEDALFAHLPAVAKDAIEVWNEPSRVSHDSWKFPNPKLNNATDLDHA
jgi:hypothetical protein